MAEHQRILTFDLETAPMTGYMWRPKTEYVPHGQRIEDSFMLTWAARWRGSKQVQSDMLSRSEVLARDDARLVESIASLVRESDIVIAHNASRFDVPRLNGRVMQLGLEPLPPFRVIDTLTLARKSFDLPYYRLDYISQVLLGEGKIDTDFDLWRSVMAGDDKAMARMVRYNRKDVVLLDDVFDRIAPYVKGLPRMVQASMNNEWACPYCGSNLLMKRGFHETNASRFQVWHCTSCSRYSRERTSEKKRLALVPVA